MAPLLSLLVLLTLAIAPHCAAKKKPPKTLLFHHRSPHGCKGSHFTCHDQPPDHCCHHHLSHSAAIVHLPAKARSALYGKYNPHKNECHDVVHTYLPTDDKAICLGNAVKPFHGAAYFLGHHKRNGDRTDCVGSVAPDSAFLDAYGGHTYNLTAMSSKLGGKLADLLSDEKTPSEDELVQFAAYQIPNDDDSDLEFQYL